MDPSPLPLSAACQCVSMHLTRYLHRPTSTAIRALALALTAVAKHFLSSRESFNATARHWAQTYAQAPARKRPTGNASDAELAGLTEASVRKFTDMGFDRVTVIATLKRLNYRGNNITNINENTVGSVARVGKAGVRPSGSGMPHVRFRLPHDPRYARHTCSLTPGRRGASQVALHPGTPASSVCGWSSVVIH